MLPKLFHTRRFSDGRGWFSETYQAQRYADAGVPDIFVQDNQSRSTDRGTIRGLHFQTPPFAQAKLVRCGAGAVWDVAVDIRTGSPTFGHWVGATLTAAAGEQLYVPVGFAHGFVTLTDDAELLYKVSSPYAPAAEGAIAWDDPDVKIAWPLDGASPTLSDKDSIAPRLAELAAVFAYDGVPLGALEEIML